MTAAHPRVAAPGRLAEPAPGVYAWTQPDGGWCVSNAGIVLAAEPGRGPLLVDTAATHARSVALREAVGTLTPYAPQLIVNTHFHGDHSFGNAVLAGPGTLIAAHERTREEMAAAGLGLTGLWPDVDWGGLELRLPDLTYRDGLVLHHGGRRVELLHPGPAHTADDTVVWLPEERVLFAGDLVLPGRTPFVLMGSVSGSLAALRRLRELEPRVVVGGHGPVAGPEALVETERYFTWLTETAAAGHRAGLDPLALARSAGPGPWAHWHEAERLVPNLRRAYAELDGAPPGAPLDVLGAFAEMVEYNGGVLPPSHA
ncbi:MBL fold metallo-hydrolase [Streptomyces sp. NPDC003717]|uniref:MBL fold metallo-hydrolase n=1 Tax=Streptomyces sp. NPDC003717 TaxID=3154276 RepID=UPI0033B6796B